MANFSSPPIIFFNIKFWKNFCALSQVCYEVSFGIAFRQFEIFSMTSCEPTVARRTFVWINCRFRPAHHQSFIFLLLSVKGVEIVTFCSRFRYLVFRRICGRKLEHFPHYVLKRIIEKHEEELAERRAPAV